MRIVWNLIEYFSKLLISTWIKTSILNRFPCKFAGTIGWYYGKSPVNIANDWKLWMRLWLNIFKSYSFRRELRRQFSTVFHVNLQAPSAGITATSLEVWLVLQKLLMRLVWNLIEYFFKSYSFRREFRIFFNSQPSTASHVNLQAPSAGITATALLILRSLIEYFKSYEWD